MSELNDMILRLDEKYSEDPIPCPSEGTKVKSGNGNVYSEHGNLTVHGNGMNLVCGRCGYQYAIGRI